MKRRRLAEIAVFAAAGVATARYSAMADESIPIAIIENGSVRYGSFTLKKDVELKLYDEYGVLVEVLPFHFKARYREDKPEAFEVYTGKLYTATLDSNSNYSLYKPYAGPTNGGNWGESLLRMGSTAPDEETALRLFKQAKSVFAEKGDLSGMQKADQAIATVGSLPFEENRRKSVEVLQAQLEFYARSGEKARYEKVLQQLRKLQSNL